MNKQLLTVVLSFLFGISMQGQNSEIIKIETDETLMVLEGKNNAAPVFHYWGNKIKGKLNFQEKRFKNQPDTRDESAPQVYPSYGGRYYLNPALQVTHADGVLTTDLVYEGFSSQKTNDNITETIIHLKDKLYPVYVEIVFTAYQKENIISQSVNIRHQEKGVLRVENIASSYLPIHAGSYYLTHFHGTWAREMQVAEEMLTPGIKVIESKKGVRTTQSENPSFLLSLNTPLQENAGDIYAGSLAWSGNYKLSFELDETGRLGIVSGINPFASGFNLKANEVLKMPALLLSYSSSGAGQISRNFHDWGRKYGMTHGDKEHPIILNSWEGAYFNFTESTIIEMIDNAAKFGVEMFVLDDGWFGNKFPRNGDNAGLGDWQVNRKKLPGGIDRLANHAAEKGMKFGIWIEPEMVNPDSELAHKHPEWIVKSGKREILPMRNQWLLDLSNPAVQDFVYNTFAEVISLSPHISYVKWDANRHADNVGSEYLPKENQSHFWYEYVKGLYNVYNRIRENYPDIQIQLCSSGGGRLDYGALKYHDEFWTSDNTNALDRIFIQYGTGLFFPAIAAGAHVSTSPNHQTGMILPLKFRFDVAMSGRLGLELQPSDLKGSDYDFAAQAVATYKKIRPVVQFGDLYRLISPYDIGGWASHMYVAKDKKEAVLFAYSIRNHGRTEYFETKLNGLNPDKEYKVSEINVENGVRFWQDGHIFSGDYLMKAGIILPVGNPFDSVVLHLEEQ
jgi:Alpha-galactosidase